MGPHRGGRRARATLAVSLAAACAVAGASASPGPGGAGAAPPQASAAAGSGKGGVKKRSIGRFNSPVHIAAAPGVRAAYVVEQPGRVMVVRKRKRKRPFLDIRGRVRFGGEQGLLSIAFHPGFRRNRLAYLYYTNRAGDNVVAEVRARKRNPLIARRKTLRRVLRIRHPVHENHNGGQLAFGPRQLLYIGTGDGGGAGDPGGNAQNRRSLLGKILRIDPRRSGSGRYSIPRDNPFVGRPGRGEIFSLGLRNPWRFSIDRTHRRPRIAIGDVGQNRFEEINYKTLGVARGANFGWNYFEGFVRTPWGSPPVPKQVKPVLAYRTYSRGRCSVVGGFVVGPRSRMRTLRRRYLYGDFCNGELRSFVARTDRARRDRPLGVRVRSLSSFGRGHGGKLYAASLDGPVYRLLPARR